MNEQLSNTNSETKNNVIQQFIDSIGFTKYHYLVFLTGALILIANGMQIILQAFLVSMLKTVEEINIFDLAIINFAENMGYSLAYIITMIYGKQLKNKLAIQVVSVLCLISNGLGILILNFKFVLVNRFFIGMCLGSLDILIFVMLLEMFSSKIRGFMSCIILGFNPLGQVISSLIAFWKLDEEVIENNYYLLLHFPFYILIVVVILVIFFQESPRRLFEEGEYEKGIQMYTSNAKIAKFMRQKTVLIEEEDRERAKSINLNDNSDNENNSRKNTGNLAINRNNSNNNNNNIKSITKSPINKNAKKLVIQDSPNPSPKTKTIDLKPKSILDTLYFTDLFNQPLNYTLTIIAISLMTGFIYNGVYFLLPTNAPELTKKEVLRLLLSVSIDIPSNIFASLIIETNYFGRVRAIFLGWIIGLVFSVICGVIPQNVFLMIFIKFGITLTVSVVVVYACELYPKNLRTSIVSLFNLGRRVSVMIAPLIVSFVTYEVKESFVYFLFSVMCVVGLLVSRNFKVETKDKRLDDMELIMQ